MRTLFDPVPFGPLTLRNRIVFPPLTTSYEERGFVTPRAKQFYATLARGGAAMIVIGDVTIQPSFAQTPYLYDDGFIPGLRELTDAIHREGALAAAQIFCQEYDVAEAGRLLQTKGRGAAAEYVHHAMETYCNEVSIADIAAIQDRFAATAVRARQAGFDVIQVHGDRLIGMFSSPILNKRTDHYGGDLENRARFAREVVRRVRAAVPDMAIDYKLAIIRTDPPMGRGGPTLPEARQMAPWLVEDGAQGFHVCLANHGSLAETTPAMGTQPFGCFLDLAAGIRQVVSVPVTGVGRIVSPALARRAVEDGIVDLVGIGRGLVADPEWPRKVQAGRDHDVRQCIMCNYCTDSIMKRQPLACAINATIGSAEPVEVTPAPAPRRVFVVGAGPGGLEAARIAAERGHHVTLFDARDSLGGQLRLCSTPSFKTEINNVTDFLTRQVDALGVNIRLGTTVTADFISGETPDAIVVATGSTPTWPRVPGHDLPHVVTAWAALDGTPVGARVAVIGGGSVGIESALFLAERGAQVTIVEMLPAIGEGESATIKPFLHRLMEKYRVRAMPGHLLVSIHPGHIVVADERRDEHALPCDTVVMATGVKPDDSLARELQSRGIAFTAVGDCTGTDGGTIAHAIHGGFRAGNGV